MLDWRRVIVQTVLINRCRHAEYQYWDQVLAIVYAVYILIATFHRSHIIGGCLLQHWFQTGKSRHLKKRILEWITNSSQSLTVEQLRIWSISPSVTIMTLRVRSTGSTDAANLGCMLQEKLQAYMPSHVFKLTMEYVE